MMRTRQSASDPSTSTGYYEIPLNLSAGRPTKAALAGFCAAAKADRQLMQETRRRLVELHRGLRERSLTPVEKMKLTEVMVSGIANSRQRLAMATEAGERLMVLDLDCLDTVGRQMRKLEAAWSQLRTLMRAVLFSVDPTARTGMELNGREVRRYDVRYASIATEIRLENLVFGPSEAALSRTPLTDANEDTTAEYHMVFDRVMRFVKAEHSIQVQIKSIEKIVNPKLDRRFYDVYGELFKKDCVPVLLMHGTRGEIAERIVTEGFNVGSQGMFGAGIYFATDTTKSAQYCRDIGVKTLLLCDVLLGRTMVCYTSKNDLALETLKSAGYDSVFAKRNTRCVGGVLNDEYIVYRPSQATPRYLVKFTT